MSGYANISNDDEKLFEKLVTEYIQPLTAFACRFTVNRETAEDLVQDVFVSLWSNRKKIDFGVSIGGYLYTMTRNACFNNARRSLRFDSSLDKVFPSEEMTDLYIIEEEFNRLLRNALSQLPPRTAEVIELSLLGLSQDEIAKKMDVTVSNVKNLKTLGIKRMRETLGPLMIIFLLGIMR